MARKRHAARGWQAKSHIFGPMPSFDRQVYNEEQARHDLAASRRFPMPLSGKKASSPRTTFAGGGHGGVTKRHAMKRITLASVHIKAPDDDADAE